MSNDVEKLLRGMMDTPQGEDILSKTGKIEQALTADKALMQDIEKNTAQIKQAVSKGDVAAMQQAVSQLSNSPEGAELIKKISELLK